MSSRTKIVCTIGPASDSPETLKRLVVAGMNVARLNFSHGSHDSHRKIIHSIRKIAGELDRPVAILQDLSGPKIRTGAIADGEVFLEEGAAVTLTSRDVPGDAAEVPLSFKGLPGDVRAGDTLLLADGALKLTVEKTTDTDILCRIVTGGPLGSNKGINLPGRTISAPNPTDKDIEDLAFGVEEGADFVALSFVRTAEEIRGARSRIEKLGGLAPIIAKIEKFEALENIEEIIAEADGIMVARGDLGVEIPMEEVPRSRRC